MTSLYSVVLLGVPVAVMVTAVVVGVVAVRAYLQDLRGDGESRPDGEPG